MRILKHLLLILLPAAAVCHAQAQTLNGKLTDETHLPLEFANVVLLNPTDSAFVQGTVTNAAGEFLFSPVDDKEYLLKASSIGYETLYRRCRAGNIGTSVLRTDAVMLQEAVVTARRPVYKMKGNALVTHVSSSLLSSAGTANDVLARIPFVQGSDGEFTVFGKGTPLIYLNGRLLRDMGELDRLDSKDIQSVEVITNPGSEYDVTVKAVIKIKTVKPKGEGFSTDAYAGATQRHDFSHFEWLTLNYRRGGLDIFGDVYYAHTANRQEQHDLHDIYVDTLWHHNADLNMKIRSHYIETTGGFNYMLSSDHSLGARYVFSRTPQSVNRMSSTYEITADGEYYDLQHYDYHWPQRDFSHCVNAYYMGTVGKLGIDFNADYYSGEDRLSQQVHETSEEHEDRYVTATNFSDSRLYAAKLILSHPIGGGELKAGAEYSFTRRINRYENPQNYLPETDNKIEEEKLAAFAEYAISIGKLQTAVGLRYEHVTSDYYDRGTYVDEQSRSYSNFFPNLSLAMPVGNTQLSLSYTAKTRRPGYNELNSNLQYNDRFTYEGGNPNLKPETIHDLTFMGTYRWAQLMVSYRHTVDAIEFVALSYEDNPAISVFSRQNYDKRDNLMAGLSLSPTFGFWEPVLSLQAQKQFFKSRYRGEWMHFNRPVYTARLNNGFRISKTFTGNLSYYYRTKGHDGAGLRKATQSLDFSLNKTFFDERLALNLRVTDILASQRYSHTIYGEHMQFDKWNYSDTRSVRLTVRYKFNSARSKYSGTGAANEELNRL